MWLKLIGSIFIMTASTFIGYILARDFSRRPAQLRELQTLLMTLENEISYLSNLIAEALTNTAKKAKDPIAAIFKDTVTYLGDENSMNIANAWEKSVKKNFSFTSLKLEDAEIISTFGKMLGTSDTDGQIRNIRLLIEQLKQQEQKAEATRAKNEGMYRRLGILAGLALVIILI